MELLSCPNQIRSEIVKYAEGLDGTLGVDLVAAYIHGSLSRGCFCSSTSDVDVLAVVAGPCHDDLAAAVLGVHREADIPIDAAFIVQRDLNVDRLCMPVEFLVKPMSGGKIVRPSEARWDILLQRQDVYEAGISIVGPPPQDLVCPVPWSLLVRSLDELFAHTTTYFKDPVLTLCRIVYAHKHRGLVSKYDAGEWAMRTFPQEWQMMIAAAFRCYAEGESAQNRSTGDLAAFEEFCAIRIGEIKSKIQ